MFGSKRITTIASTALVLGMGFSTVGFADDDDDDDKLPPIDNFQTIMIDKSVVAGQMRECGTTTFDSCFGPFEMDVAGNLLFDYTGDVYSVKTDDDTAELEELDEKVGTIAGTAAFPPSFGMMAIAMKAGMTGMGPMPGPGDFPQVIDWTCNTCTMVIDGSTFRSIVDAAPNPAMIEPMRMKGRAFTGLGPVEVGQLAPYSLSVRMAGCSAIVGTDGSNAGKVGTLCLNGTFTFDMGGLDLVETGDPSMPIGPLPSSVITGTGSSNCVTVLHTPMM